MNNKLYIFLLIIFYLFLTGCTDQKDLQDTKSNFKLTLKQAIELAYSDAVLWNKQAKLIDAISIDNDEKQTGGDGKRRYWNITFGLPNTNDFYLVNIHDGKINEHVAFPNEGEELRPKEYFITNLSEIKYDTTELLKKAKSLTNLYPGDVFAKGYNFGITKDPRKNIILIKIIGWDKARKKMKYLLFNGETGELHNEFEKNQYKREENH
ncbi:hypothetical protein [Virgibacillus dokdonensis]|uniref:hypothetical protein n=1 Tax=Virgibacillus dokdonensis TaxID=302167 RepID=UPI000989BDBF|nr:hypothetical protein [Virgibacillus dokdonensis]